jgi:HEAT repeat protein
MPDFAALLAALFNDDPTVHTRASLALFDAGPAAVQPLLDALNTPAAHHRLRVINLLSELQDRRATPALVERLRSDPAPENRRAAAGALRDIDDFHAVPALLDTLTTTDAAADPALRFQLVTALDYYALPSFKPVLRDLLNDTHPPVARLAAATLARTYHDTAGVHVLQRDVEADDAFFAASSLPYTYNALSMLALLRLEQFAETFRSYLTHPTPTLRMAAALGLGKLEQGADVPRLVAAFQRETHDDVLVVLLVALADSGDARAVGAILKRLQDDLLPTTRLHMARTLGQLGDPIAVESLRQMVDQDIDPSVRYQAILSLADIAHPVAIDLVRDYAHHSDSLLRQAALKALGLLRDAESLPLLTGRLQSPTRAEAHMAAVALLQLNLDGVDDAYAYLLSELFHGDYAVCWFTLHTLEQYPDERFIKPLLAVLEDEDSGTREMAVGVLGDIGDDEVIPRLEPLLHDVWAVRRRARQALLKLGYTGF